VVVHIHLDEDISGEELSRRGSFLTIFDFDDIFGRHQHLADRILESHLAGLLENAVLDPFLKTSIRMDDVPLLGHSLSHVQMILPITRTNNKSARAKNNETTTTRTITTVVEPIVSP